MTTSTATTTSYSTYLDSAASVSYLNLLGIGVSVVFTLVYLVLGAHAMKYLKSFACKIKIIVNRAEDKELKAKDYTRKGETPKKRSLNYYKMEDALKNEVKKSRSPYFLNIFACYMAKYDHLVYYPFRSRMLDKIELLRPKPSFYAMLDVASICISWISTILLVSLIQELYKDITTVSFTIYALFTAAISLVTSILSLLAINRFHRLYELNIKNAFKVDYGNKFVRLADGGLNEYNPENSQELEDIKIYQEITKGKRRVTKGGQGVNNNNKTQSREDTLSILNSTRKLLGDDLIKDEYKKAGKLQSDKSVIHEEDNEDDEEQNAKATTDNQNHSLLASKIQSYMKNQKDKNRTIQDLFGIHTHVEGFDGVPSDQKFLFIEDKHHIGDLDLLNNEANKGENSSNILTFTVMFAIICISTVVCCYLNYTFTSILSKNVFYMFLIAFVGDLLAFRVVLLFLYSLLKTLVYCCKGYKRLQTQKLNVKNELSKAIRDIYTNNKKKAEPEKKKKEKGKNETEDLFDYYTGGMFAGERNDTSLKHFASGYEENKEDDYAQEIVSNFHTKRDDDQDGEKVAAERQQFMDTKKPFDLDNKSFNTQVPFLNDLQKQLAQKQEEEKEEQLIEKQDHIVNELADYNLLLFRKVFDAYDEKGERVLRQFRKDKNNVLRKRYVQSVVNPNYDYDKLIKELERNKLEKEEVEEDPVNLDGEEVQEDSDEQQIQGVEEESHLEDESKKKIERELINRFGKKLDEEEKDVQVVLPMPEKGIIEQECEENIEEEDADEWSKLMKELAYLRMKKKSEEGLTEKEEKRLVYLEQQEDHHRQKEIEELEKMGSKRSKDEENQLRKLLEEEDEYRSRRINDLQEQETTSEGLDEEEKRELKELLEWQNRKKRKLLEELRTKKRMGTLTEEEERLLKELEEWDWEQNKKELEMLREKLRKGMNLSEQEKLRLKELEEEELNRKWKELEELRKKKKNGTLTEEEQRRLNELEAWAESLRQNELDELRRKLKNGTLTEEERRRLEELEADELQRMMDELEMLREKQKRGSLTQEEMRRLAELEEWDKLRKLNQLEDQENNRLKVIEDLLNKFRHKGLENLSDLERLDMLLLEKEKCEILCRKLRRIDKEEMTEENIKQINDYEDEIDRLEYEILLLKQKLGLLSEEELQKLRELETKFKMNEMSEIDKHEEEELQGHVEEENENPFEEQNMLNEQQRLYTEEQQKALEESQHEEEEEEDEVHDRLTDDEMFADLPAIEVMNKIPEDLESKSRAQSQMKSNRDIKEEELSEHSRNIKSQLEDREKMNEQDRLNQQDRLDEKERVDNMNQNEREHYERQEKKERMQKMEEEREEIERIKSALTNKNNVPHHLGEEEQNDNIDLQQREDERNQYISEQDKRDNLTPLSQNKDDMFTPKSALKSIHENERLNTAKSNVRFKDQEEQEREDEKLRQLLQSEEELNNQRRAQSQMNERNNSSQSMRRTQEQQLSEQQQQDILSSKENQLKDEILSSRKSHQRSQFNENEEGQNFEDNQDKNESLMNFSAQEAMAGDGQGIDQDEEQMYNKQHSRLHSAKSKQMQDQQELQEYQNQNQRSKMNSAHSQRQKLDQFEERPPTGHISNKSLKQRESELESERQKSRMSSRQQVHSSHQRQPHEEDEEDYQRDNIISREQPSDLDKDQMMDFGHDDLEMGGAPGGPQLEPEESIYSHQTSTILDEEKVSFMHIEHLPNQDNASDDSFSEQDMVYYNKDDLTNYSKGLGLNKVKAKAQTTSGPQGKAQGRKNQPGPQQQYYSENDIQEMQNEEGEVSDSGDSAYTLDAEGRRVRNRPRRGQGQIRHNDLEVQSYDDQIDGRVKVDAWNLNYRGKKKKLKKKKLDQNTKNKMNDLQNIYGVDARTLAGLQKGQMPKKGSGKDGDDLGRSRYNTDMSFRSTQNTFLKQSNNAGGNNQHTSKKSIDGQSNMFSFNGGKSVISKRWNDIESTLKGGKVNPNTLNKQGVSKRLPMSKLTSTQQNFRGGQPGYMEEETKSNNRSSNGSFSRGNQFSSNVKKGGGKGKGKGQGNKAKGYDSYSESDEGVNDQNAMFQSRDPELQSELFGKKSKKQTSKKKNKFVSGGMNDDLEDHSESDEGVNQGNPLFDGNDQLIFKKRGFGESSNMKKSTINQASSQKRGNGNKGSEIGIEDLEAQDMDTGKKKRGTNKKSNYRSSDDEGNLFGLQQSRQTTQINRNNRMHSEASDLEQNNPRSNTNQYSNSKPPLSNNKRRANDDDLDMRYNNGNTRPRYPGGHTDTSDNERQSRNRVGQNRRHSMGQDDDNDDADSYLVGPQSNHSMIRSREMGGRQQRNQDDRYMLLQRDTEIIEDMEANGVDNQFAKKRKVKRAAQSTNFRDANSQKAEYQRNERLKRKQIEEEKMLVQRHREDESGSVKGRGLTKMKKKKEQKDQVRKEVNYWLDYDSPYAEYLVARFREWSPNVGGQGGQGPSSRGGSNSRQGQNKLNEVSNLYGKNNQSRTHYNEGEGQGHSKPQSKSPQRVEQQEQRQKSNRKASVQKQKPNKSDNEMILKKPFEQKQVNNLFAEDFEDEA